jgi:hypothetical protein
MTNKNTSREQILAALKEWVAPVLLSVVGMLLWRDISEMRADVKLLLTQQSANQVKIDNLEKDVELLKSVVFSQKPEAPDSPHYTVERYLAVKPDETYGPVPEREEE